MYTRHTRTRLLCCPLSPSVVHPDFFVFRLLPPIFSSSIRGGSSGVPFQDLWSSRSKKVKMNRCGYQQNAFTSCEEMRMGSVVCPKPHRLGLFNYSSINDNIRPFRRPINYQPEIDDSGVGAELLDIIRPKDSYAARSGTPVALSPPFFCGSPPSRASNPVVQDEQFGNGNFSSFSMVPSSPSSSSARGCVRMKFGHKPAAVRIEGFDCLSRDRRNCNISAVA